MVKMEWYGKIVYADAILRALSIGLHNLFHNILAGGGENEFSTFSTGFSTGETGKIAEKSGVL